MADWQPALAVLPRVFEGLEGGGTFGVGKTAAVILVTCLVAGGAIAGLRFWHGKQVNAAATAEAANPDRNEEPAKRETPKASAPEPLPKSGPSTPAVPDPPKGGPSRPAAGPAPPPKVEPKVEEKPGALSPQQVKERCAPSVAFVDTGFASGSGFLLTDGYVVTNSHVVECALGKQITLMFPSSTNPETSYQTALCFENPKRDLAILRITTSLKPLKLAASEDVGEPVVVIGSPGTARGEKVLNLVTPGALSGVDEKTYAPLKFFLITAPINPGNSGGPVFNGRGEVLGVATQFLREKQSMNYIIPYEDVGDAMKRLRTFDADEVAALRKKHDTKAVAARLLTGVNNNFKNIKLYAEVMDEAIKAKTNPKAVLEKMKKEKPLEGVMKFTAIIVSDDILSALKKLGGQTAEGIGEPGATLLHKVKDLYDESMILAADPETIRPPAYLQRTVDMLKQLNDLMKELPKGLDVEELERAIH